MTLSGALSDPEWEALYRRLETPLYNLAYRYVWNRAEAQDVVHEAFLNVWARRDRVLAGTADRYLWTTVLNLARKRRRWQRTKHFLWGEEALQSLTTGSTPEQQIVASETERDLEKHIARLPETLRAVLLLSQFSGMTQETIAQLLHIPPGTVASRRNLALKRLRMAVRGE